MKKHFLLLLILISFVPDIFGSVALIVKHHDAPSGSQVTVPVRVKDFVDIVSAQGTIDFDPAILGFVSVQDFGVGGMNAGNFGTLNASSGKITFSWYDATLAGVSLADSAILFSLKFTVLGTLGQLSPVSFSGTPTQIEIADISQVLPVVTVNGAVHVQNTIVPASLTLKWDTITGSQGSQVAASLRATNFRNINSIQGTLAFDPAVVTYSGITFFGLPGMGSGNFGTALAGSGKITFSWTDPTLEGINVADGAALFTVTFQLSGPAGSQSVLNLAGTPTPTEVTDSLFQTLTVNTIPGYLRIAGTSSHGQLRIRTDSVSGPTGSQVIVPVRGWHFRKILSMQGTIGFDQSIVTYAGTEQYGLTGLDATAFGTAQISSGKLMFSWSDPGLTGQTLPDSAVIFAIRFNIIGFSGQISPLNFITSPTPPEFIDSTYGPVTTLLQNGRVKVTGPSSLNTTDPAIHTFCTGDAIVISFTTANTFNPGNNFILQLSDASGSFGSPVVLGSISGTNSGSIPGTIPSGTLNGSAYRFRVVSTNPAINGSDNGNNITIYRKPLQAVTPAGDTSLCINPAGGNYSTAGATDALSYQWIVYPAGAGIISGNGSTAGIDWDDAFSGFAWIKVRGVNGSCTGLFSDSLRVRITTAAGSPQRPSGDSLLCINPASSVYTITPVVPATSYLWQITPAAAGSVLGSGTSITIDWNNAFTGTASIQVTAYNGVCAGPVSPVRNVIINAVPTAPAAITGSSSMCLNPPNTMYYINTVASATSYTWTLLPAGAGTLSPSDTTAVVDWNPAFSGTATLTVYATNQNCQGAASPALNIDIINNPPAPSLPSGPTSLCLNPSNSLYTVSAVPNANSYIWTLYPSGAGTINYLNTNASVNWNDSYTGAAHIFVTALNGSCSSPNSDTLDINIAGLPATPLRPVGDSVLCLNSANSVYTIPAVPGATSYEWILSPGGAGTLSGTGTTATADWDDSFSGVVSVLVRAMNGSCPGSYSPGRSVSILSAPVAPANPSGPNLLCIDPANTVYSVAPVNGATSYNWTLIPSGAGSMVPSGNSVTVDWDNAFTGTAQISVSATNVICTSPPSGVLNIDILPLPATPAKPDGDSVLCMNPPNSNYFITSVAGATSYEWFLTPPAAGIISGNSTSASVNWDDAYTGTATISVRAVNNICPGNPSPVRSVTILGLPATPLQAAGDTALCLNPASGSYSVATVSGATTYNWVLNPALAGTLTPSGNNVIVDWNDSYIGQAQLSVSAGNGACNGLPSAPLIINIHTVPAQPALPAGQALLCQGSPDEVYTTVGATGAASYQWALDPPSAGNISGNGTSGTASWNPSFFGSVNISVQGINTCGAGVFSGMLTVNITALPPSPGKPSGDTILCINAPNTAYSVVPVSGATSYQWLISPAGAGSISGTSNTASVDWNDLYTGVAEISVAAVNTGCSGSPSPVRIVNVIPLPSTPAQPSGDTALCINPADGIYSVAAIPGATTYNWTINPSTAGTLTPSGNTVSIEWNDTYTGSVQISAGAGNGICNGPESQPLTVNIHPAPAQAAMPAGNTDLCAGTPSSVYTTTGTPGAVSYNWELSPPTAGSISGNGLSATVTWSGSFTGLASIRVQGVNNCGSGIFSGGLAINVHPAPAEPVITLSGGVNLASDYTSGNQWYFNQLPIAGATGQLYTATQNGYYYVIVTDGYGCWASSDTIPVVSVGFEESEISLSTIIYPNPTTGGFGLKRPPILHQSRIVISNALGIPVFVAESGEQNELYFEPLLPDGLYLVEISNGHERVLKKLLIRK